MWLCRLVTEQTGAGLNDIKDPRTRYALPATKGKTSLNARDR